MLSIQVVNKVIVVVLSVIMIVCSIGIMIAIKFQSKKNKKYEECLRLIKEKENGTLNIKNGVDEEEIKKIDKNVDINKLMTNLYNTYLKFIDNLNNNYSNFNDILNGFIKEFYENKIDIYVSKGYYEVSENIELLNYSIIEYDKEKLKFRINITCFNYKKNNNEIISGSNLERVEQIFILTYVKVNKKWLISNVEKVYEKN